MSAGDAFRRLWTSLIGAHAGDLIHFPSCWRGGRRRALDRSGRRAWCLIVSFRIARRKLRKQGLTREPTAGEVGVEAAGLPGVADLIIGKRQFGESLCDCTFHRRGGECDCSKCTY